MCCSRNLSALIAVLLLRADLPFLRPAAPDAMHACHLKPCLVTFSDPQNLPMQNVETRHHS